MVPTTAEVGLSYKDIDLSRRIRDAEKADPGVITCCSPVASVL
jgi:hypothetical protein